MRLLRNFSIQYQEPGLHPLLVVSELMLIAVLAFMASQRQLTLVLFVPFAVGLVLTFLRWPTLGLIVAFLSGFVIPFSGPSGLNVTMILVALLLVLWLLDMVINRHQIQLARSRTIKPLLFFIVIALISFGVGQLNWLPFALHAPLGAQLGGLAIIVLSAGTFLLVANLVHDLRWLSAITWAFLAFSVLAIVLRSLLPGLGFSTQNLIQPIGAVYYIWVVSLAISQALLNGDLHPGWRWALGGLVLVTLYNQLFLRYDNKSGWIPALVCLAAMIAFRSWRAALILVPLAALAVWIVKTGVVSSEDYSVSTRIDAWLIMAQIIKFSPILGLGFANYYWYTPLFPIRGYAVSFNSHNNYVDIVAQTGLVGLFCFLWLLWEIGRLSWRLRERAPAGFAQAYVYGVFGGLAGTMAVGMMGDWVLPFFYNIGLTGFRTSMLAWLFLGGLVSLQQIVKSQKHNTTQK